MTVVIVISSHGTKAQMAAAIAVETAANDYTDAALVSFLFERQTHFEEYVKMNSQTCCL